MSDGPRASLVRAIVERRRREREADPDGFQKMGEPELVDWLHANPKHPEYKRSARVLEQKQNARQLVHGLDSQPPEPAMPEERDRLTLDPVGYATRSWPRKTCSHPAGGSLGPS